MIPRLAVLLSGSGSTLQNLIDRIADGRLSAKLVGVVSSRPDVRGVTRANAAGIPTVVASNVRAGRVSDGLSKTVAHASGSDKPVAHASGSDRVFDTLRAWQPDFVVLAGWVHLLTIPPDFALRVVNVHPSLLPAFGGKGMYGRHVHEAVLASGARFSGCTVHFADDTYDTGPIIHQSVVPVLDDDTSDTLAARVQAAEREAYPDALAKLTAGGWRVTGKRVMWD